MLIFGLYDGERITLDVSVGMTVKEVREMIQTLLNISVDQYRHDKKVLVLSWAGSDLQDPWVFSDLGIVPGTTIRVNLKEEVKPVLYIHCTHSQDTLSVYDNLVIGHMQIEEMRSLASRKTGLPIGIFRLITQGGKEMYDGHLLEDYGVDVGHTIFLENLDGWNEFLNLAIMGFTPQVVSQISQEEIAGRYQMKVALFLAAHFGHVDLARAMLRQGIKASEPIGYPPQRMWCNENGHIESKKAAVHQAVLMGQLGVLRLFVNNDITVITAKDGNGLTALNIALRKKIKNCASFLLTKQWSKVSVTKNFAIHIGTYTHLRQWCERAKERAFMKYGHSKSSLKRRPFQTGPLVGFGVNVDGFSKSIMTGKSKAQLQREKEREKKKAVPRQSVQQMSVADLAGNSTDPESYFKHVSAVQSLKSMGDKVKGSRWGRMAKATSKANLSLEALTARSQVSEQKAQRSPEPPKANGDGEDTVRLPPIMQKLRARLVAQSRASAVSTSSDIKEPQQQQQQQQQPPPQHVPAPPAGGEKRDEKSILSKLVKGRGAYFMAAGANQQQPQPQQQPQQQQQQQPLQQQGQAAGKGLSLQLPNADRVERGKGGGVGAGAELESQTDTSTSRVRSQYGAESVDTASTVTVEDGAHLAAGTSNLNPLAAAAKAKDAQGQAAGRATTTTTGAAAADATAPLTSKVPADDGGAAATSKKKKRRGRVTSALLLSKAKSSEGAIPLPLISTEQDRRPFFYYNGKRGDAVIDPTISTWSKHSHSAGSTPRERAIRSLSVANTFKEKPWLGQVQIALRIASNPTKRSVRRLRSAGKKRTFAIP